MAASDLRRQRRVDLEARAPDFVACSGAITDEFFHSYGESYPAEWTPRMGRFDLVTFSFGGDDIGFPSIVEHCLSIGCPPDAAVRSKIAQLNGSGVWKGHDHIPSYPSFLLHVATAAVSTGGNMVVMGYPELVEDPSAWTGHGPRCEGFTRSDARTMRGWAGDLNATLGEAVRQVDSLPASVRNHVHVSFVNPVDGGDGISPSDPALFESSHGERHELCSPGNSSWLNGTLSRHLANLHSLHPNQAGEDAMGTLMSEIIPRLVWPWDYPKVPVVVCPTTAAVEGDARPQPQQLTARALLGGLPAMAEYTDDQGIDQLLAPSGWNCSASIGADSTTVVDVWPPGARTPGESGLDEGVSGYVIPGSDIEGQFDLVCPLFPADVVEPVNGLHETCPVPSPPPTETDRILDTESIAFHDPPGVSGSWNNLSGSLPVSGVLTFDPNRVGNTTDPVTGQAACLLPAGQRAVCTAAIDDFATHYGGL